MSAAAVLAVIHSVFVFVFGLVHMGIEEPSTSFRLQNRLIEMFLLPFVHLMNNDFEMHSHKFANDKFTQRKWIYTFLFVFLKLKIHRKWIVANLYRKRTSYEETNAISSHRYGIRIIMMTWHIFFSILILTPLQLWIHHHSVGVVILAGSLFSVHSVVYGTNSREYLRYFWHFFSISFFMSSVYSYSGCSVKTRGDKAINFSNIYFAMQTCFLVMDFDKTLWLYNYLFGQK